MPHDSGAVRVAIDNDYPVVVAGLAAMLAGHSDRVEVVTLGEAAVAEVDVVLKDAFALNEDFGVYVQKAPGRVLVFAASEDDGSVRAALDQGAAGYVHKGVSVERLVEAIERADGGEDAVVVLQEGRRVDAADAVGTVDWPGRADGISDRESEVLALICQGLSNQEVAQHLYLSINSIKTYIRTLYRKIGVQSRSQAVIWGLQHGFSPEQ